MVTFFKDARLKKDIETDILMIGNNLTSALFSYSFSEHKIHSVIIDKGEIKYLGKMGNPIETEEFNFTHIKLLNETNRMEHFKEILGIAYDLDDLNKKLKNKIDYSRNPNISYKGHELNNGFPLFTGIYYDFGIKINKFKLIKELFKYIKRKKVKVYSHTEVVFYSLDYKNNIIVMTNKGYKIKCKKIINMDHSTNLYSKVNILNSERIENVKLSNNVLDNLMNAKTSLNNYLGKESPIKEKTV